jgi:hypothetical protein
MGEYRTAFSNKSASAEQSAEDPTSRERPAERQFQLSDSITSLFDLIGAFELRLLVARRNPDSRGWRPQVVAERREPRRFQLFALACQLAGLTLLKRGEAGGSEAPPR